MPQLSKKQFIILALIIILVTIFIIVSILNGNNNNIQNNQLPSASDNTPSISNNDYEQGNSEEENNNEEEDLTGGEIDINTQPDDPLLTKIQKRIEVVVNKNSELIFRDMFTPTPSEIEKFIGVDLSMFDSYLVRMNQSKFSSELYMIFKPFEDDKAEAKTQIKKFLLSYESAWSKLDEQQYNLILNRTAVERNGYIIYIISIDNNTIMSEIRNFI